MASLLIKNGLVVDTEWTRHSDILVEGSRIRRIARNISVEDCPEDVHVVDAAGLCVLPGIIDAHTHYHLVSRGTVTADSFLEGSKLASYGGVTTVVDFADDNKVSLLSSTKDRLKEMREMSIDYALHQGVYAYRDSIRAELNQMKNAGVGAIKIFTTYKNVGYLVEKREELKEIFSAAKELGILVCVHAEDDSIVTEISENWKGQFRPEDHPDLRPSEAEAKAIRYVGEIAGELDMPIYIVHVSSKAGIETIRDLREKGVKVIAETTPHYLFLDRSKLSGPEGPLYVMTPPLRTKEDNEALQEALVDGEIQVVATDHCSFTREQKLESSDVRTIYPGIPGTEELLPLIYNFGHVSGQLSIGQIVNLLSTGPAKAFGLYPKKGVLQEGSDADIVLFDPSEIWTISSATTHSASHYTPYEGMTVMGRVKMTYLRGRLIMGHDIYLGLEGDGQFVKAHRD
ncbi:MAG: dihydropyrimidinase [Candidatus Ornithospirochaeta sp.]|nr:dihydropyrimidinase [Sphaerochaetaceae bacterium]MDY5522542.1 dihydropyrimidinase [Candidatus Ornithospirochaeta sp.]